MKIWERHNILDYATERGRMYIEELKTNGGNIAACARHFGVDPKSVRTVLKQTQQRFEKQLPDLSQSLPPTIDLTSASVYGQFDEQGNFHPTRAWSKGAKGKFSEVQAISDVLDAWEPTPVDTSEISVCTGVQLDKDLLSLYTITDYHLGLMCSQQEVGEEWNIDKSNAVLRSTIQQMCRAALPSDTAILNIQGDFLHWDGLDALTPMNKHPLDASCRFGTMVDIAFDLVEFCIKELLKFHHKVEVIICEGNHDLASSCMMRKAMKRIIRDHRVHVQDKNDLPYYGYLFGKVMLGFHHGHCTKFEKLPEYFAAAPEWRAMWGCAVYTYLHCGHYHTSQVQEIGGAIVERHPTIAAHDSYARRNFVHTHRGAHVITYHVTKGEIARATVRPY